MRNISGIPTMTPPWGCDLPTEADHKNGTVRDYVDSLLAAQLGIEPLVEWPSTILPPQPLDNWTAEAGPAGLPGFGQSVGEWQSLAAPPVEPQPHNVSGLLREIARANVTQSLPARPLADATTQWVVQSLVAFLKPQDMANFMVVSKEVHRIISKYPELGSLLRCSGHFIVNRKKYEELSRAFKRDLQGTIKARGLEEDVNRLEQKRFLEHDPASGEEIESTAGQELQWVGGLLLAISACTGFVVMHDDGAFATRMTFSGIGLLLGTLGAGAIYAGREQTAMLNDEVARSLRMEARDSMRPFEVAAQRAEYDFYMAQRHRENEQKANAAGNPGSSGNSSSSSGSSSSSNSSTPPAP